MTFDIIFMGIATQVFSQPVFVVLVIGLTLVLLNRHRAGSAVALGCTALCMAVSVDVLKDVFQVARPAEARITIGGYGWPSGHAAAIAWLVLVLWTIGTDLHIFEVRRLWRHVMGLVALAVVFVVGFSRVFLGVHTVDQVMAGYGVGALWGAAFLWWYRKEKRELPPV